MSFQKRHHAAILIALAALAQGCAGSEEKDLSFSVSFVDGSNSFTRLMDLFVPPAYAAVSGAKVCVKSFTFHVQSPSTVTQDVGFVKEIELKGASSLIASLSLGT